MKKVLTTLTLLITLCSFAFGQNDNYFNEEEINPGLGDNSTVTSLIYVDGVLQTTEDIEIAAYFNGELRGHAREYVHYDHVESLINNYYRNIVVFKTEGVTEYGDVTFKGYNHDKKTELMTTYTCNIADARVGSILAPVEIYFTTVVQGVAQIVETEEYYETLAEAVEAAEAGQTITLLQTTQGEGIVIDKSVTIDFNGNIYSFTSPAVGSNGTQTIGFQIKKDNNVTLKNGTLNVLGSVGEDFAMLIQNYANLTVTDMTLDGKNLNRGNYSYVLSNNSGNVLIDGETNIFANDVEGEKHFAFDSYDYSSAGYALPTVTVNTKGAIEGAVEVSATLNLQAVGNFMVSYFAIEGNGQLYTDVALTTTIKRTIKGTSEGWGTLSAPMVSATFSTSTGHDFYQYVESAELEWNNIAASIVNNTYTMTLGRGYLYANENETEVSFVGDIKTQPLKYPLSYTDGKDLAGFNFIGNPFTHNISFAHLEGKIVDGYYVVGEDGTFQVRNTTTEAIAPFQAVLIKATEKDYNFTINKKAPAQVTRAASNGALEIRVSNTNYSDVAYVSFNEGLGLEKIGHQNANAPLVYLTADNKNFAIAKYNQDVNEIPVSFIAKTMGQYTISVKAIDCEFNEMYLTDRMTGEKVNLLIEDYTFVATGNDNADRFVISFATTKPESVAENFIYMNNGNMIINNIEGNAVVRVLDVLGRPVAEYNVTESANISTASFRSGVYMIQMYDNNGVKVQKIVVE